MEAIDGLAVAFENKEHQTLSNVSTDIEKS